MRVYPCVNADPYRFSKSRPGSGRFGVGRPICARTGGSNRHTGISMPLRSSIIIMFLLLVSLEGTRALQAVWLEEGVAVCTAEENQDGPQIVGDGVGGAFITWYDNRNGHSEIFAQWIDRYGDIVWSADGIAVTSSLVDQADPQIISDRSGGVIITWWDRTIDDNNVYAQRMDPYGGELWGSGGIAVSAAEGDQYVPKITVDNSNGAIITWVDDRGDDSDIFIQRIGGNGVAQWSSNGVSLCSSTGDQYSPQISTDCWGGAIVTWVDGRSGENDIYAGRVAFNGVVPWDTSGVMICGESDDQWYPRIVSDDAGGAIIAWRDRRNGKYDIYAQKIDASGALQWQDGGVPVCVSDEEQYYLDLAPDLSGGVIVTWDDRRSGNWDIYAQRIDSDGGARWSDNGVAICRAVDAQQCPRICCESSDGAVITWRDRRSGKYTAYAQKVDQSGTICWKSDGVAVCTDIWTQWNSRVVGDGAGGAIVTWEDYRNEFTDIYVTRITADGNLIAATFLECYSSGIRGSSVVIEWSVSSRDGWDSFHILRTEEADGVFREIPFPDISSDGLSFVFKDESCRPGITFYYRVETSEMGERCLLFETGPVMIPVGELTLLQNFPNPFNPSTLIQYSLPAGCMVRIDIFSTDGRRIARLVDDELPAGSHSARWNGLDDSGIPAGSGVYIYRLRAGKMTLSRKMLLLR